MTTDSKPQICNQMIQILSSETYLRCSSSLNTTRSDFVAFVDPFFMAFSICLW
ncbi:hypothetical protein HanRHA438_Chr03g0127811 [Helianthus annuus]|nr:hypothetical protein HanRHA438_Chr03g0127811 [Helianthus annuus]